MLAGEPDAGNLHVRFDEREQRDRRKPPVALYSTDAEEETSCVSSLLTRGIADFAVQVRVVVRRALL
jgi:hypothetical protein